MSATDGKPTPRPTPDRAAWLLSPVSSLGRLTIGSDQYEELRAESTSLQALVNAAGRKMTPDEVRWIETENLVKTMRRELSDWKHRAEKAEIRVGELEEQLLGSPALTKRHHGA